MGQRRQGDGAAPPGRWGSAMGNSFGPRTTVLDHMIYGRPLGPPQAPPVGLPQAPGTLSKAGGSGPQAARGPGPGGPTFDMFFFFAYCSNVPRTSKRHSEVQNTLNGVVKHSLKRSAGASHRLFRRFERARSGVRTTETSGNPALLHNSTAGCDIRRCRNWEQRVAFLTTTVNSDRRRGPKTPYAELCNGTHTFTAPPAGEKGAAARRRPLRLLCRQHPPPTSIGGGSLRLAEAELSCLYSSAQCTRDSYLSSCDWDSSPCDWDSSPCDWDSLCTIHSRRFMRQRGVVFSTNCTTLVVCVELRPPCIRYASAAHAEGHLVGRIIGGGGGGAPPGDFDQDALGGAWFARLACAGGDPPAAAVPSFCPSAGAREPLRPVARMWGYDRGGRAAPSLARDHNHQTQLPTVGRCAPARPADPADSTTARVRPAAAGRLVPCFNSHWGTRYRQPDAENELKSGPRQPLESWAIP
eukprot:gene173-biopygen4564